MGDLDRIETKQAVLLNDLASSMATMASEMSELAKKVSAVAEKSDQTAERWEDSIQAIKSYAESQVEIREILAEHGRRLDALENKQAS